MINPYTWQEPLIDAVVHALTERRFFISGFPTGSGKTVIALAAAKRMQRPHLILAPKVALTQWCRTAKAMGCDSLLVDVINPEKVSTPRGCYLYTRESKWHLPKDTVIVWDEPHRSVSGMDSISARAMAELKAYPSFALHAMTATVADSPIKLRALGYWAGLHNWLKSDFYRFCKDNGCANIMVKRTPPVRYALKFTSNPLRAEQHMRDIRKKLGECFMSLRPEQIPGFPEQTLRTLLVDLDTRDREELDKLHENMSARLQSESPSDLVENMHDRERIEHLMTGAITELVQSTVENGESAVVFWNFTEPREQFEHTLREKGIPWVSVYGGQKDEERQKGIDTFQKNKVHVASIMIEAGGAALSLHDETHTRPRVSFIPPSWRADSVKQCLGRIRRCNGTNVTQNFVFAAGTVQERVAVALERKLSNIDALNDGDLAT